MAEGEDGEEDEPGEAHGVPVPGGRVDGDLAQLDALEAAEGHKANEEREQAENQVGGVQTGDEVEEVAGRGCEAAESESLGGELASRRRHWPARKSSRGRGWRRPGQGAADGGATEAEPFLEHIDFVEDVAAREFHGEAAEQEYGGVEEEDGRQQDGAPVADLFVGPRVEVGAGLTREEKHDQDGEEHHVAGRAKKTDQRIRLSDSRGPRFHDFHSSSPPPPPPPVGRRSTGGLPPILALSVPFPQGNA